MDQLCIYCQENWENLSKTNVVEDKNALLFNGYNKEEVNCLGINAQNCAGLGSACSSTVCSEKWLHSYIQ